MKFILLLGLVPFVLSLVARRVFCDRVTKRYLDDEVAPTGREFAESIIREGGRQEVEIIERRRPFLPIRRDRLVLSPRMAASKNALDVAESGLRAALTLLADRQVKVVEWRVWAVKAGFAIPAFSAMVLAFAVIVGRLGGGTAVSLLAGLLGVCSIILFLTLTVEREAARMVSGLLDSKPIVSRRSESDMLAKVVSALAWRRLVPGRWK